MAKEFVKIPCPYCDALVKVPSAGFWRRKCNECKKMFWVRNKKAEPIFYEEEKDEDSVAGP